MRRRHPYVMYLLGLGVAACVGPAIVSTPPPLPVPQYGPRIPVTVVGYAADVMEPFVTRDGQWLLFNNSNAPDTNTNLHLARRVNDTSFTYLGPLAGANSLALDAVASVDQSGQFYFTTTRSYSVDYRSIYRATFTPSMGTATVSAPTVLGGTFTTPQPGRLVMDAEVSADGNRLYFAEASFSGGPVPTAADLALGVRNGVNFDRAPNSSELFAEVNTPELEYAPATTRDQLTLFFTRAQRDASGQLMNTAVWVCVRENVEQPFQTPVQLLAATGPLAEAATVVGAGAEQVYYHARVGNRYRLFLLRRLDTP